MTRGTFRYAVTGTLLAIVTLLLLGAFAEVAARTFWPRVESDSCLVRTDRGLTFRPNCSSKLKAAEGPWVTDQYNACGYRTDASCGPKPLGVIRIALLGSSMTVGQYVSYDQIFATRTGDAVSRALDHPVQVENLAVLGYSPLDSYRRLSEAISLQPNVVIFAVAPTDLEARLDPQQLAQRNNSSARFSQPTASENLTPFQHAHNLIIQDSTLALIVQHYAFHDTAHAIRSYLLNGDKADFLRTPFSPAWKARFAHLETLITEMAARLHERGIPLILVAIPSRVEAGLLNARYPRPHVDAFAFGNRIKEMADHSGSAYVDLLHPFSKLRRPEDLYFTVNNHPNSEGHLEIARQLAPTVESVLRCHLDTPKKN